MKLARNNLEKETVNFLLGKVGKPHITSYVNHVTREANAQKAAHAIISDIHALNFPVERQTVNNSRVNSAAEAFFEMKINTA